MAQPIKALLGLWQGSDLQEFIPSPRVSRLVALLLTCGHLTICFWFTLEKSTREAIFNVCLAFYHLCRARRSRNPNRLPDDLPMNDPRSWPLCLLVSSSQSFDTSLKKYVSSRSTTCSSRSNSHCRSSKPNVYISISVRSHQTSSHVLARNTMRIQTARHACRMFLIQSILFHSSC